MVSAVSSMAPTMILSLKTSKGLAVPRTSAASAVTAAAAQNDFLEQPLFYSYNQLIKGNQAHVFNIENTKKLMYTAQKMKFPITDFFSKCDQIRRKLRIWSQLLKESIMENFIFCAVIEQEVIAKSIFHALLRAIIWKISSRVELSTWYTELKKKEIK